MSTAKEQREARNRQRQKERREEARKARLAKTDRVRATPSRSVGWPVTDAWISQDWYERERVLHGALVRGHGDGARAVLLVSVDTSGPGLTEVVIRTGLSEGNVNALVADRAAERPMASAEPEDVARLLHDGLAWRRRQRQPDPKGLDDALRFLGDLDPDVSSLDVRFGAEDEEEDTVEVRRDGLLGRFAKWTGLVK